MALALQAVVGSTTYNLSDGSPFSLETASGLGMAPVMRYEQTAPLQDGATDLGFNLTPRVITLSLNFVAETDAILDGYRDDLNDIFKPSNGQAIKLRVTRDDAAVRQIDTHATANDIELVKEERPGHLHRAIVQLRADNPTWYDPTAKTSNLSQPDADWWLGGNTIGTAMVLEHVENPSADQAWTWTGTADIVFILWRMSGSIPPGRSGANFRYAWTTGTTPPGGTVYGFAASGSAQAYSYTAFKDEPGYFLADAVYNNGEAIYPPWTDSITAGSVYGAVLTGSARTTGGFLGAMEINRLYQFDQNNFELINDYEKRLDVEPTYPILDRVIGGGRWRGNGVGTATQWPGTITHAAIYQIGGEGISAASYKAVAYAINAGTAGTPIASMPYDGEVYEYPVITITGPIGNPVVTNLTTGDKLDFTGSTVPAGVTYTIDLSANPLSVIDSGGTIRTSQLTADSALGTWAIVPHPIAIGGTNVVTMDGNAVGSATTVEITYYNRYLSY